MVFPLWNRDPLSVELGLEIPFNSKIEESVYYRKGNDSELIKNPSLEEISDLLFWVSNQQPII